MPHESPLHGAPLHAARRHDARLRDALLRDALLHAPDRAGILYAEDFDGPAAPPPPMAPEPEPLEPTFSSGEMEVARQTAAEAAVARARSDWLHSDANARTVALCKAAAALADAQEERQRLAEAAADGMVRAILGMAAAMLPGRCAGHGDAEVRMLLRHLLPTLQGEPRITVRVGPSVLDAVRADISLLDEDLAACVTVAAADLPPGDARVAWADGSLVRDTAALQAAVAAALGGLGLVDPAPLPSAAAAHHAPARGDAPPPPTHHAPSRSHADAECP